MFSKDWELNLDALEVGSLHQTSCHCIHPSIASTFLLKTHRTDLSSEIKQIKCLQAVAAHLTLPHQPFSHADGMLLPLGTNRMTAAECGLDTPGSLPDVEQRACYAAD